MMPFARVTKLEGQMNTLFHNIKTLMWKLIDEFEERV